jgi:hydrogenase small subunit
MHSKRKPKILWIDAVGCNGCSHSFFNYSQISSFFEDFELLYHPLIFTSDFKIQKSDILIIEGSVKTNFPRLGYDLVALLRKLMSKADKIIALGTCASFGGMFGEGLAFNKFSKGRFHRCVEKIINIPGCPAHPEWLMFVLKSIKYGRDIPLDDLRRPLEIFAFTSHTGCCRNEYFEWKIDAEYFGTKEGCLFYKQGCQGPFTHSSCNRILWNEVSSKPRVGTPCFGCTEPSFPKENLFKTETFMGIPSNIPLGVSKRAYLTLSGIAKSLQNERLNQKIIKCENENDRKNSQ